MDPGRLTDGPASAAREHLAQLDRSDHALLDMAGDLAEEEQLFDLGNLMIERRLLAGAKQDAHAPGTRRDARWRRGGEECRRGGRGISRCPGLLDGSIAEDEVMLDEARSR